MKRCIACGAILEDKPIITLDDMPSIAQNLPDERTVDKDKGVTISLYRCTGCGLVQHDAGAVPYYKDVIRAGGYSTTMEKLRISQYDKWIDTYDLRGKKIIEVGCGRGEFLSILDRYDVHAVGMEHDSLLVEEAREDGLDVFEGFAGDSDEYWQGTPYDAFTSFNFLEHQPNPCTYLRAAAHNLVDGGYGLITVPSFEYILEQKSFYEIIPDHISYYTSNSLEAILGICGFEVLSCERINRDTISAFIRKRKSEDLSFLSDNKERLFDDINSLVDRYIDKNQKIAIWGASHQGLTICGAAHLGDKISCIIDSAPFKQGRYAPSSHIKIVSPEFARIQNLNAIIIVAPGYTDEIAGIIKKDFGNDIDIYTLMTDKVEKYGIK